MDAALRSLARLPARRRVAVLGAMAELGDHGGPAHRRTSELAHTLGIEVIAVGAADYGTDVVHVADLDAARAELERGPMGEGTVVLVKGSRVAGLERLAAGLAVASE